MSRYRHTALDTASTLRTQILVIGSGAGGAITAATCAGEGYDVLLVEEGPNIDTATIDSNSTEAISRLYRAGGMTPILGDQSIAYVEGRCVGGSTEINSGFWHRLPPDCYHRWKTEALLEAFTPDMMERYFERVEADLHVSLLGSCPEPKSSALFRQGIERLHWDYAEVPRCQKDPSASAFARGAKQSMQRTYIPRALRAGARLIASCKVRRIIYEDGRAVGVHAALTEGGRTTLQTIKADTIFVCCGAVQTPALLRRSGIRKHIGNNLCIHPMIKAAALFEDDVDAQDAPLPIYQVKEFGPTIAIGGAVFTPGFLAMILSDNWEANRDGMQNWRRMALYYAGTRGTNRGSIRVLPGTDDGVVIRYHLTGADQRNLSIGLARLGELLFAAGATAVYPSVRGLPVLRSVEQCRSLLKNYIPLSSMGLSTVHAFSSAPMGENPDFCATDSFGRVKGFSNLYINDASLIPDSPGVNPQATTMVIALRNIEHFAEASRRTAKARQTCPCKADVLITGAPGWLGSRLVEIFYNRNGDSGLKIDLRTRNVRCLVQATTDPSVLRQISDAVEIVRGDLTDPESVREFCRNAEGATLFHIAGLIHPKRATKEFYQVNVEGTRQVIEAAQNARVKRIVAVSSNSCIGCNPHPDHLFAETSPYNPYMHYGRSKMQMERLVNAAHARGNIETVIIRAPWFYGPHQPLRQTLFFRMIKEGKFPILGNGEQKRSMAYVDNICQGLLLAATVEEADGQTYWIADERPYTISEIVDTVESIMEEELGIKCSKKRLRLPPIIGDVAWLCDFGLQSIGFYNQKIHVLSEMNKTIACSIEKAMAELGYRPRYSLREGMAESLRWCVANGHQI